MIVKKASKMADVNENVAKKSDENEANQVEESDFKEDSSDAITGEDDKKASSSKQEKNDEEKKDEEEEESEEEEHLGILDQSPLIDGKRERTVTKFFMQDFPSHSTERIPLEIRQGKGMQLADIPYVVDQLSGYTAKELQPLHKLLYNRIGKAKEVKKNIRQFSGFGVEKDSKDYEKRKEKLQTFTVNSLRNLCEIFGVDKGKDKEDKKAEAILERVMDFLMEPKVLKEVKPVTKSTSKRKRTTSKKDKKESKGTKKSKDEEESDEEEEEEEKTPPKKKAKSSPKKKENKKSPKKDKKVVAIKIAPKKSKKQKDNMESAEDSDDEPLVKKTKKSPPTDDELVSLIQELLDGADLEKITMKSVCKQVFDKYPDFDLSSRKDFIKESVKEIIT